MNFLQIKILSFLDREIKAIFQQQKHVDRFWKLCFPESLKISSHRTFCSVSIFYNPWSHSQCLWPSHCFLQSLIPFAGPESQMSFSTIPVPNYGTRGSSKWLNVKSFLIFIVQDKLKVILSKIWDVLILMRKFNLILVKIHSEEAESARRTTDGARRRTASYSNRSLVWHRWRKQLHIQRRLELASQFIFAPFLTNVHSHYPQIFYFDYGTFILKNHDLLQYFVLNSKYVKCIQRTWGYEPFICNDIIIRILTLK